MSEEAEEEKEEETQYVTTPDNLPVVRAVRSFLTRVLWFSFGALFVWFQFSISDAHHIDVETLNRGLSVTWSWVKAFYIVAYNAFELWLKAVLGG